MKEKKRDDKQTTGGSDGSLFDGAPDLPVNPNVSVASGPYCEDLPVSGSSVGEVRQKFSDRFDIDDDAQAIVGGKPAGEDYILQTGEALMFIKHAGEKGAKIPVTFEDKEARFTTTIGESHSMPIAELAKRMGQSISTGDVVLPSGIRAVLSQGDITVWVWEKPPHIARLSWIREDSPSPHGPGTIYRFVRIGLPYLLILAVFQRDNHGLPQLTLRDECFFRNDPLNSLNDELLYPGLLNCSKFRRQDGNPLSWICTQHLKQSPKMLSDKISDRFQAGFEAVRYCLLETSFNLSSEHHEGNSWYGANKKVDDRISNIGRWEECTNKDPLFALTVPWLKTGFTLEQVVGRIFKHHNAADTGVKSSEDVARIIING